MSAGSSNSAKLDAMLREYMGTDEMRDQVARAADAMSAAAHAELAPFTATGVLDGSTRVETELYAQGWGLRIKTLWRGLFVANSQGFTRNRTSFRRGAGQRRAKGWRDSTPTRAAAAPPIVPLTLKVMDTVFETTSLLDTTDIWSASGGDE
jgi:hypothetical protein